MELATHLEDAHIAALLREHAGPGTAAEILQEQFPYGTKIEDACRLHEEMIRIETSWAYHAYFGMLRTACAKASLPILVSTWTPAAQQPFPFPTAVMLLHAAAATTDSGASRVDGMCWALMKQLNQLCSPELVLELRTQRRESFANEQHHNELALRWQRDAVEGAGFGRTQRRLGRTSRATPTKLRRGSSAFFHHQAQLFVRNHARKQAPAPTQEGSERSGTARRASLMETDHLPTSIPAAADASASADSEALQSPAPAESPPPSLAKRPARLNVSSGIRAATLGDAAREAPPSARRGLGRAASLLRSASSRRRARKQQQQRFLIPRADRVNARASSHAHAAAAAAAPDGSVLGARSESAAGSAAHAERVNSIWGASLPKPRQLPGPAAGSRAVQFAAPPPALDGTESWVAETAGVERSGGSRDGRDVGALRRAEDAERAAALVHAFARDTSRRAAPQLALQSTTRAALLHECGSQGPGASPSTADRDAPSDPYAGVLKKAKARTGGGRGAKGGATSPATATV